jgi:hypothetical protein
MKKWIPIIFIVLYHVPTFSQTGPAGVGTPNTNVFWIKADKGTSTTTNGALVSAWNDQSGNNINVTQTVTVQQPSFAINVLNGFPGILFDNVNASGQNDFLLAPDNPALDNTAGYSFFTVTKMNFLTSEARSVVSKRTSIDIDEAFMLFYYTGNNFFMDIDGIGNRQSTSSTYTTNTGYIMDGFYNGTLPAASRSTIYEGEALRKTFTETSALVPDKPSPLNIGCTHSADSRPFGGYISEVIIYTVTVNDAQRIIVNNYLSSKYTVGLSANDKYAGDLPANGYHYRDVAGIGMESSGSNPTFSASISAGLTIANTAGLDIGDYILAGHASVGNAQILYDVGGMTGINNARWARIWYLDITNTGTPLTNTIEFDMSDGGVGAVPIATASNYVLLYRTGLSGNWTELTTASSISGDRVIFTGITLTNDGYYTIGTRDYLVSPLPIELLSFNAVMNHQTVNLDWATASEKGNAYFTVEKSKDGISFESLLNRNATGNTSSTTHYTAEDPDPFPGISYYRLKQTDNNGQYSYSTIVSVDYMNTDGITVFPNPSNGEIHLSIKGLENQEVVMTITDMAGKQCLSSTMKLHDYEQVVDLTAGKKLAPGAYIVMVNTSEKAYSYRVTVK